MTFSLPCQRPECVDLIVAVTQTLPLFSGRSLGLKKPFDPLVKLSGTFPWLAVERRDVGVRLVAGPVLRAPVGRLGEGAVVAVREDVLVAGDEAHCLAGPGERRDVRGLRAVDDGRDVGGHIVGAGQQARCRGECPAITRARVGGSRCSGNSQGQGRGDGNASCRHPDCQFRWSHKLPPCLIVTGGRTEMGAAIDPTAYIEAERGPVPGRVGFRADVGNRHGG